MAHCILQHRELDERVTAIHQNILIAKVGVGRRCGCVYVHASVVVVVEGREEGGREGGRREREGEGGREGRGKEEGEKSGEERWRNRGEKEWREGKGGQKKECM